MAQVTGVTISMMSQHWCLRIEKEWKNGGVSGVEESTECRRDQTCLLHQFIAIDVLELGSHASLRDATDEINILLVGMLHDRDTSI